MTSAVQRRRSCRACGGDLLEVLNLGDLRLNAFPTHPSEIAKIPSVPLILTVCPLCTLVQLDRTVPADWMYRTYYYRSGVNESMIAELQGIVEEASRIVSISALDKVLDIGANDGTTLAHYRARGGAQWPHRTAVEPADNLQDRLVAHCEVKIHDYFPTVLLPTDHQFKIVTAVAMAYDLEDPVAFFQGIRKVLHRDGIAIVQFQDFRQQIACAAFDNIAHEHLEYYTLHSLKGVIEQAGLKILHCQETPSNGGSLRVRLTHSDTRTHRIDDSVRDQFEIERRWNLSVEDIEKGNLSAFDTFRRRTEQAKAHIRATLDACRIDGAVVDVYGASTKGNTLLQVMNVGPPHVRQAIDRSPEKHDRYTITGIPIVSEEIFRADYPDVALCNIWQFREGVLAREREFLQCGRKFVFCLPSCEIVMETYEGEARV